MDKSTSRITLPNDIDDVSLWKLYILLSRKGITAVFRNEQTKETITMLHEMLSDVDEESLGRIQDIIYENPVLLNDYQTTIILDSNHFIIAPSNQIQNDEDALDVMETVYPNDNADLWADRIGEETIIFLTPEGLQSFINRTFPTAEVKFRLSPTITHFRHSKSMESGKTMQVNILDGEIEIVAFKNSRLLLANIFACKEPADAIYYILNAWAILDFDSQNDELRLTGDKTIREQIMPTLRKYVNYVMLGILPQEIKTSTDIPLAISLCYQKN